LLLLGTQWYLLFNVIAGASAIPTELDEACRTYRFGRWLRWRKLVLPAIFPYLITALITASGGAWNASIVAEYFHLQGDSFYHRVGRGDQPRIGRRQFPSALCRYDFYGRRRCHGEPACLEKALPDSFREIQI